MKVSKTSAYALHALMYMVRHMTQLPATAEAIAKTEGIPACHLSKILRRLTRAGFVQFVHGRKNGYVFARPPEEITPMELLEVFEGQSPFDGGHPRGSECGRTSEGHPVLAEWVSSLETGTELFEETTIVAAAWNDLEHRFGTVPHTNPVSPRIRSLSSKGRPRREKSSTLG